MDNETKRGRGRPRKTPAQDTPVAVNDAPVKRGRGRPPLTPEERERRDELRAQGIAPVKPTFGQEYVQPGDNTKFLAHAMAVRDLPPINRADPAQVEHRIREYFDLCGQYDMKPTVKGLCNSLRITRQAVFEWKQGNFRAGTHQAIILQAYDMMEELWENYMLNGKINPVSGIFLGKNQFEGYSDKQEFVLTPNKQQEVVDVATLEAKYAELPDCED